MSFKEKTIRQIRIWAWAAAVLPITALASVFFVWAFFDDTLFGYLMVVGQSLMFAIAVIWWWWAMYTMKKLVKHWDETRDNVRGIVTEVKEIKSVVLEVLLKDK